MNLKEIFEKIYNGEITKNDVIVVHQDGEDEEYDIYILNDGYDYWDTNGVISLSFFSKKYEYSYEIITREEHKSLIEKKEKQERIAKLKKELKELEEN